MLKRQLSFYAVVGSNCGQDARYANVIREFDWNQLKVSLKSAIIIVIVRNFVKGLGDKSTIQVEIGVVQDPPP